MASFIFITKEWWE